MTPIPYEYIDDEGKADRMGARLMAIVAEGERGRVYLSPTAEMEAVARDGEAGVETGRSQGAEHARNVQVDITV